MAKQPKQDELIATLAACGREDATELAKFLIRERICACGCDPCALKRRAKVAADEVRPFARRWVGEILNVGNAWLWVERVSTSQDGSAGRLRFVLTISRAVSSIGHLVLAPAKVKLSSPGDGQWFLEWIDNPVRPPTIVEPGTVRELPLQAFAECPACGGISIWAHRVGDDEATEGYTPPVRFRRADEPPLAFCDGCNAHRPISDYHIRRAPASVVADGADWEPTDASLLDTV